AAGPGMNELGRLGADKLTTLTNPAFRLYAPEGYARAIADRAKAGGYRAVVFAASATGKDLAPRVAARLERPLAQDVTDVAVEAGAVVAVRPVYAGKALPTGKCAARPAVLTRRSNRFTPGARLHATQL